MLKVVIKVKLFASVVKFTTCKWLSCWRDALVYLTWDLNLFFVLKVSRVNR